MPKNDSGRAECRVCGQRDTIPLAVVAQAIIVVDQGEGHRATLLDRRRGTPRCDAGAMGLGGDVLAPGGQMVRAGGMGDGGEARGPLAHQRPPAPEQLPGGAPRGRIDLGRRDHAATQPPGDLIGIQPSVLRLAPVNRLHREGVAPPEGHPRGGAAVGAPIPRAEAFDTDDTMCPIGSTRRAKRLWPGLHMPMDPYRSSLVEDTAVHGPGMQIEATGKLGRCGVKSQTGLLLRLLFAQRQPSHGGTAEEGASRSINTLQRTGEQRRVAALHLCQRLGVGLPPPLNSNVDMTADVKEW
jgi:RNA polymerase subunit RPABC4/transcription elongation factor Spt4